MKKHIWEKNQQILNQEKKTQRILETNPNTIPLSANPYETLSSVSNRIINEVKGINRVAYDISSKPPSTIEWE